MKNFLQQIFKDKDHNYSLREVVIALLILALMASWIATQFFQNQFLNLCFTLSVA
jgi:hypothetical protein